MHTLHQLKCQHGIISFPPVNISIDRNKYIRLYIPLTDTILFQPVENTLKIIYKPSNIPLKIGVINHEYDAKDIDSLEIITSKKYLDNFKYYFYQDN